MHFSIQTCTTQFIDSVFQNHRLWTDFDEICMNVNIQTVFYKDYFGITQYVKIYNLLIFKDLFHKNIKTFFGSILIEGS